MADRLPADTPLKRGFFTDGDGNSYKTLSELRSQRDYGGQAFMGATAAAFADITCLTWGQMLRAYFDETPDVQSKMTCKVIGPRMVKVYFTAIVEGAKITDSMTCKARKINGKPHWDVVEAAEKAADVIGRMHNAIFLNAATPATVH